MEKTAKKAHIRALTPRATKFAELVAGGQSYSEAYKEAYHRPHLLPQDAALRGHKVAKTPAVRARIEWLRNKSEAKTLLTINDRLQLLATDAQVPALTAAERNARARSIEVYTKIAGGFRPEQHEVSGPAGGPVPVQAVVQHVNQLPLKQRFAALRQAKAERDENAG